jgi:hypothetical protein
MELERHPGQVTEPFILKAFDSDRVDVAPGSNVVGENDQIGRRHVLQSSEQRLAICRRNVVKSCTKNYFCETPQSAQKSLVTFPNR